MGIRVWKRSMHWRRWAPLSLGVVLIALAIIGGALTCMLYGRRRLRPSDLRGIKVALQQYAQDTYIGPVPIDPPPTSEEGASEDGT